MKNQKNQIKDGFLRVKNFYIRTLMPKMEGNEFKILMFLLSETEGWNKKTATLTNTRIAEGSGLSLNTVKNLIEKLKRANIIECSQIVKDGLVMKAYTLQEDLEKIILPTKEKLSNKITNFFSSKAKKETFITEKITLNVNNTHCRELTPSNIDTTINLRQSEVSMLDRGGVSKFDSILRHNILKTYHKDIQENDMNVLKIELDKKSQDRLSELEFYTDILKNEFGFFDAKKILFNFGLENIKENIDYVRGEAELGLVGSKGALLRRKIISWKKEDKKTEAPAGKNLSKDIMDKFKRFLNAKRVIWASNEGFVFDGIVELIKNPTINLLKDLKKVLSFEEIQEIISFSKDKYLLFKKLFSDQKINDFLDRYKNIENLESSINEVFIKIKPCFQPQKNIIDSLDNEAIPL